MILFSWNESSNCDTQSQENFQGHVTAVVVPTKVYCKHCREVFPNHTIRRRTHKLCLVKMQKIDKAKNAALCLQDAQYNAKVKYVIHRCVNNAIGNILWKARNNDCLIFNYYKRNTGMELPKNITEMMQHQKVIFDLMDNCDNSYDSDGDKPSRVTMNTLLTTLYIHHELFKIDFMFDKLDTSTHWH